MSKNLTIREKRLVKGIIEKGLTPKDAARLAGYSENTADSYLYSTILKRDKIKKILDENGLNDKYLVKKLKKSTKVTKGEVVTTGDSLRAIELAFKLKGYTESDKQEVTKSNTNIYIKELKVLNNNQLLERVNSITKEVKQLKE